MKMKKSVELSAQIRNLRIELGKQIKLEKEEDLKEFSSKFRFQNSLINQEESWDLSEIEESWTVFHNGIEFDFRFGLSPSDSDNRRETLENLEEQGLIGIIRG